LVASRRELRRNILRIGNRRAIAFAENMPRIICAFAEVSPYCFKSNLAHHAAIREPGATSATTPFKLSAMLNRTPASPASLFQRNIFKRH
jgi:hypothetical protein